MCYVPRGCPKQCMRGSPAPSVLLKGRMGVIMLRTTTYHQAADGHWQASQTVQHMPRGLLGFRVRRFVHFTCCMIEPSASAHRYPGGILGRAWFAS